MKWLLLILAILAAAGLRRLLRAPSTPAVAANSDYGEDWLAEDPRPWDVLWRRDAA